MSAHCALCKRGSNTPAYVACSNCGQFACDSHHWVWMHGRAAFCQECWYDSAGKSLVDLTDALAQAGHVAIPGMPGSAAPLPPERDSPPAMVSLARLIRNDDICRQVLHGEQDPLIELAILLRRVAELLERLSRKNAA